MTLEEFEALLRAHGADRRRWPERARVSAEALLERDPAAQALLAKAEERAQNDPESAAAKDESGARDSLTGQLLIAMPAMPDPRFSHSVIFMCMHDERGAMGIIVNQVVDGLEFEKLLEQVGIRDMPPKRRIAIHVGGPVETGRDSKGFFRHVGGEAALADGRHGEADALDTDGVADRHAGEVKIAALHLQWIRTHNAAHRLHDAREHAAQGSAKKAA